MCGLMRVRQRFSPPNKQKRHVRFKLQERQHCVSRSPTLHPLLLHLYNDIGPKAIHHRLLISINHPQIFLDGNAQKCTLSWWIPGNSAHFFLYILMEPQLLPRHFPLSAGYTEANSVNAGWFVFFGPGTVLSPFAISAMGEEYINNAL